ncbi:hypothetical protein BWI17_14945 [Betaproteobacteria bacterium GR16-43]|nr:hypothetical protein BWI17_14945 [Betaproteobacteria bacterium GR16-43]
MATLPDYYEILGIPKRAKLTDVTRAYNRWVAEFKKESTAPDPRRESLLREAFEILSDDDRRDAYDKEMAAQAKAAGKKPGVPVAAIAAAVLVGVAGAGAFFFLRSPAPPVAKTKSTDELQFAMAGSVSPIVTFDVSGKVEPVGLGFVIENKVMVANCKGVPPGVQLMVNNGKNPVAARVTMADEALGICKILTDSYVGEPLGVSNVTPVVGAKVYAASLGAKGEVGLRESTITKVVDDANGKAILSSFSAQAGGNGGPLLDAAGKVVAVATLQADGSTVHRVIPPGWLAANKPVAQEPKPYQPSATATAGAAPADGSVDPGAAMLKGQKPANWDEMGAEEKEQWERGQAEIQRRMGAIEKGMRGKK